jgi:gluconate 2-dehydrogenase gamma chain
MDRRQALQTLATALPAASLLHGCKSGNTVPTALEPAVKRAPGWSPRLFSPLQALVVEDAAERLIPETNTPGATSAGVGEFIETVLRDVYDAEARQHFLAGVDALNQGARGAHGLDFPACSAQQQSALLEKLVAALPKHDEQEGHKGPEPFLLTLRELTIVGFCNSRLGATRVLSYEPIPGHYQGCVAIEGNPAR